MNLFGGLARAVVLGGILMVAGVAPTLSASTEIGALEKYIGMWKGAGMLNGDTKSPVTCKMQLSEGNGGKLNYQGRCSLSGQQLSVTGTIAWVDANKRYEAVMNSGIGGFRGVAIGKRSGDKIVFDLQQRADDDQGNDITIAAKVILSGNSITTDFHAVFNSSGDTIDTSVPFEKA